MIRDSRIDFVKGCCILLMVWGHLPRMGVYHGGLECVVHWIYTFHVQIFALITGYLFGKKMGGRDEFIMVLKRMFKPYFVMGIVSVALYWVAARIGLSTSVEKPMGDFWRLLYEIVVGRAGGALWYLHTFGIVELLVLASLDICGKMNSIAKSEWAIVCLTTGCVMSLMSTLELCVGGGFLVYFLVGYFIRRCNLSMPSSWIFVGFMIIYILLFRSSCSFLKLFWVLSVLGSLMAVAESWIGRSVLGRALAYIGNHTLPILIFHSIFAVAYRPISAMIIQCEPSGIGLNIIMFSTVILSCLITEWGINKTPIRKLIW